MRINLNDLVARLDYLGLDYSPITNLINLHNSGVLNIEDYNHLLATLKDQSYRPFPGGSEPISIKLLLTQLSQSVIKDSAGPLPVPKVESPIPPPSPSDAGNEEILSAIHSLANELKGLKTQQIVIDSGQDRTISKAGKPRVEMEDIFVNPVSSDDDGIEANVTIKSVKTSNALDKLRKLKKIKGED